MKLLFPALLASTFILSASGELMPTSAEVFGQKYGSLDNRATGEWWKRQAPPKKGRKGMINLDVPRSEVIGFAVYTLEGSTLKMTAQLYPLKPDETQEVRLEVKQGDQWKEIAKKKIVYPGWSAHFRITDWDGTKDHAYRLRHAEKATFEGKIRREPTDKETIVVGNLSCNSSRTTGPRPLIIKNLIAQDPDILFFAGDQTYHHTQHTSGWLEFGMQFRDIMRDRPTVNVNGATEGSLAEDDFLVGSGPVLRPFVKEFQLAVAEEFESFDVDGFAVVLGIVDVVRARSHFRDGAFGTGFEFPVFEDGEG
ncbi:hypothetical protein N9B14_04850, partial [Akkermansiaceae bacterium]|nr:hypothetical protein [Akkermansiaceae bacterium]